MEMIVNTSEILNKVLEIQINFTILDKIHNMGKIKEMFGELEQQDMLDADYQYEQWLETQKLELKNLSDGNIK
jgi:hypothetical protein